MLFVSKLILRTITRCVQLEKPTNCLQEVKKYWPLFKQMKSVSIVSRIETKQNERLF